MRNKLNFYTANDINAIIIVNRRCNNFGYKTLVGDRDVTVFELKTTLNAYKKNHCKKFNLKIA